MAGIPINYTVLAFCKDKYRPVFHGTYVYDLDRFFRLTTDDSQQRELVTLIASDYYYAEWKHAQQWFHTYPLQFKLWYQSFDDNNSSGELTYTVQLSEVPTLIISESEED